MIWVVALVGTRPELDFLDVDDVLLGLGLGGLLLLKVLELAVVHQTTDRRLSRGRDFDQVHVVFGRHAQGVLDADDAQRLVLESVQTDFQGGDLAVQAVLALDIGRPAIKKSSDGQFPSGLAPKINEWCPPLQPGPSTASRHPQVASSAASFWEKASRAITPRS